jgi:hypothetical protein
MPQREATILLLIAGWMGVSLSACSQESMMTNASPSKQPDAVKAAVAQQLSWDQGDIEVGRVEKLDRGGCRFYRASNPARTDAAPVEYAFLPDGSLVGGDREQAKASVGALLQACGSEAPAEWWAQVVSRFAGTGGLVVDENAPSAIRRLRKAGIQGHAPSLRRDGDSTVLTYFSNDYERSRTREVTATLDAQGRLSVESKEIGGTE